MDELGSRTVNAVNINRDRRLLVVFNGGKAAGEWVEMKESNGEGILKAVKKMKHERVWIVIEMGRFTEEEAFLDVVGGEHGEIPRDQMIGEI